MLVKSIQTPISHSGSYDSFQRHLSNNDAEQLLNWTRVAWDIVTYVLQSTVSSNHRSRRSIIIICIYLEDKGG